MISIIIPSFNAAEITLGNLSILRQIASGRSDIEIIVVDDGSTEDNFQKIKRQEDKLLRLVRHASNRGRSAARNSGAKAAKGDFLLFIDCDCFPESEAFVDAHLRTLEKGADVSLGPVSRHGNDFWAHHQEMAAEKRRKAFFSGKPFSMTSANLFMRRSWFLEIGGFDESYRGYGFEDRDFLLRLSQAGARIAYTPEALVFHDTELALSMLIHKMNEAGRTTAPLFRKKHPEAYRQLGYARLDTQLYPWLIPFVWLIAPLLRRLSPFITSVLEFVPLPLASMIVRALSASAFMEGSLQSRKTSASSFR